MRTTTRFVPHLESLESRLAPAKLINAATLRYRDVDGDTVSVALSKPLLNAGTVNNVFLFDTGSVDGTTNTRQQLQRIDLAVLAVNGISLTVTAQKSKSQGGNNRVNVGHVNATGFTVGKIVIAGDLGQVDAGDGSSRAAAKVQVRSLGALDLSTQGPGGSLISVLNGGIGKLIVTKDVVSANFQAVNGSIGLVSIGGSLIGAGPNAGLIHSGGNIGTVTIGGDIIGGDASNAGSVQAGNGVIESITVQGSLRGGSGDHTGMIQAGILGKVTIGGDVVGGSGPDSGVVRSSTGNATKIIINGSVIGGSNEASGLIGAAGNLQRVRIAGNLIGGSDFDTGVIQVGQRLASALIGGSVISGFATGSAFIKAGDDIGSLTITRSVLGTAAAPVIIQARGQATPAAGQDQAIGSLSIGGRVHHAIVRAGFDLADSPVNADAQIGKVVVGGDWVASSLAAGIDPVDAFFGNGDDVLINEVGDDPAILSSVASVVIKGNVLGTPETAGDAFGITAQHVGTVRIDGSPVPLTLGPGNDDLLAGLTDDFRIREL